MRYYSSSAGAMTLTSDITAGTSIIGVSSVTGLPTSFPYTIVLDVGQAAEEICTVTSSSGAALTVTRGQDGTSAQAHSLGAVVRHMMTARDLREPQDHIAATSGVHGVTGAIASTTDVQTLTNKTLNAAVLTGASTAQQTTFQSSADGVVPLTVAARASQTANLQEWKDAVSAVVSKIDQYGVFTGKASNIIVEGDAADTPAIKVTQERNGGRTVPQVDIDTRSDDTADAVRVSQNATAVFKIDGNGNLLIVGGQNTTNPPLVIDVTGKAFLSDLLTMKSNAGATVAKFDKDGKLTAAAVTSNGAVTATGAVTGSNIPSTIAATSASKDKKRIHWGTYATGPLTGGIATITHSAGFTPTAVVITPQNAGLQFKAYNFTATTFDVQVVNSDGSASATQLTISAFLGE